jgi:hypothetical protein
VRRFTHQTSTETNNLRNHTPTPRNSGTYENPIQPDGENKYFTPTPTKRATRKTCQFSINFLNNSNDTTIHTLSACVPHTSPQLTDPQHRRPLPREGENVGHIHLHAKDPHHTARPRRQEEN